MQNSTVNRSKDCKMWFFIRRIAILLFMFFYVLQFQAQKSTDSLIQIVVELHPKKAKEIRKILKSKVYDSLTMKTLYQVSEQHKYSEGAIFAYNSLGKINRINTNFSKALFYHQKALDIAEKIQDLSLQVYTLNMIGVVYRRMDAVKSALEYHNQALELAMSAPDRNSEILHNIAISHNSIGNIYLLLERDDLALLHFQKALKIEEQFNNKLGLAINYQNIGSILYRNGDMEQALMYYNKSLNYNREINSKVGEIICNTSIAKVYVAKNNPQKALEVIKPILPLAKDLGDNYYLSDVYINLGKIYRLSGDIKKADAALKQGLEIANDKGIPSESAEACKQISILREQQGNYKEALAFHQKFTKEQSKILNNKNRQMVTDLVIKQLKKESQHKLQELGKKNKIVTNKLNQTKKSFYFTSLLSLLAILIILLLYYRYKLKSHSKLVNMEQDLLRAQMNPHFIFNSLNSIKLFIIQNRAKDAVKYLSKFSKFVRSILQSTFGKEMTLEEEINTLKLYVDIENIRFNNPVHFDLEVDERLNIDQISIPPLLTQPFVENALWHGLSLKETDKVLSVSIQSLDKNHFRIVITDNGVGRKRAMKIKAARTFKRESVGIKLSKERLKYFSKKYKGQGSIIIEDLYENTKPIGTKVIIVVPMR